MTKINKLSPKQLAKFPEYVRKWLDIGLSTAPLDKDRESKAIDAVYRLSLRRQRAPKD